MHGDARREAETKLDGASAAELAAAILNGTMDEQIVALTNPLTPTSSAMSLVAHSNVAVLDAVAARHDLTASAAEQLLRYGNDMLSSKVAANPNLPVDILLTLHVDDSPYVRAEALANPTLPADAFHTAATTLLERFAAHIDAERPGLPDGMYVELRAITTSPHATRTELEPLLGVAPLRPRVAVHPNCDDDLLGQLLIDVIRLDRSDLIERAARAHHDETVDAAIALNVTWPRLRGDELLELAAATVTATS